ncbi:MAG: 6-carboxytetrahydropterin synthase [Cyclobacteriaceae bacterium]|nr:6-carboxytetrahydropterin synthase [Cyclobacteriaceae bacterium]
MIYITRKEHFNAAHKLYNTNWSEEKNLAVFGPCANANWHGHNFDLYVTVKGKPDPETGFVMNYKDLSKLVRDSIIERVDHKNLNLDVDFLQGKLPSCETLIYEFWQLLAPVIPRVAPNCQLHALKLFETHNNYAEYFGE